MILPLSLRGLNTDCKAMCSMSVSPRGVIPNKVYYTIDVSVAVRVKNHKHLIPSCSLRLATVNRWNLWGNMDDRRTYQTGESPQQVNGAWNLMFCLRHATGSSYVPHPHYSFFYGQTENLDIVFFVSPASYCLHFIASTFITYLFRCINLIFAPVASF